MGTKVDTSVKIVAGVTALVMFWSSLEALKKTEGIPQQLRSLLDEPFVLAFLGAGATFAATGETRATLYTAGLTLLLGIAYDDLRTES